MLRSREQVEPCGHSQPRQSRTGEGRQKLCEPPGWGGSSRGQVGTEMRGEAALPPGQGDLPCVLASVTGQCWGCWGPPGDTGSTRSLCVSALPGMLHCCQLPLTPAPALHCVRIWAATFPGSSSCWADSSEVSVRAGSCNWGQSQKKPCHSTKCCSAAGAGTDSGAQGTGQSPAALPALPASPHLLSQHAAPLCALSPQSRAVFALLPGLLTPHTSWLGSWTIPPLCPSEQGLEAREP